MAGNRHLPGFQPQRRAQVLRDGQRTRLGQGLVVGEALAPSGRQALAVGMPDHRDADALPAAQRRGHAVQRAPGLLAQLGMARNEPGIAVRIVQRALDRRRRGGHRGGAHRRQVVAADAGRQGIGRLELRRRRHALALDACIVDALALRLARSFIGSLAGGRVQRGQRAQGRRAQQAAGRMADDMTGAHCCSPCAPAAAPMISVSTINGGRSPVASPVR